MENAISSEVTLITREGDGNQKDANMLEVTSASTHFDTKTIYLLYKNEFIYNMSGDLAAGKVYLNPRHNDPSPSHAPMRMKINWDIVNGIKEISDKVNAAKWNSGQWYGLDGRPLNGAPTRKGLYFHDGKKVIIKEDL